MKPRCWFADLPDAGPCEGRLVRCHLVPQQLLKREGLSQSRFLDEPATWVWGCGGPTGVSGHHGAFDYARTLRVPRHRLPQLLEYFCAEHGLTWWLDREYGPIESSSSTHGDDARAAAAP